LGAAGLRRRVRAGTIRAPLHPEEVLVPALLLVVGAHGAPAIAAPRAAERAAAEIRALLATQVEAWNRGDLEAFMATYWRSDSLTFYSGGDVSSGWRMAYDRYQRRYQSEGRAMGTLAFDIHRIQVLSADAAIVKGGWSLALPDGAPRGLFTLVMRRIRGAGWRIVHDHSSAAAAP
jgi:uncharacterized protein (TIGR02246 family)